MAKKLDNLKELTADEEATAIKLYAEQEATVEEIAVAHGVPTSRVERLLRAYEVEKRRRGPRAAVTEKEIAAAIQCQTHANAACARQLWKTLLRGGAQASYESVARRCRAMVDAELLEVAQREGAKVLYRLTKRGSVLSSAA